MPPQTPYQPPTLPQPIPNQSSKYDFIMSAGNSSRRRPFGGGNFSKLVLLAVVGVVVVVILLIASSIFGGGKTDPNVIKIAQEQTELIRVSQLDYKDLAEQPTLNLALNTQLSMISAQQEYLKYLSEHGIGIKTKELGLAMNPQTDSQLTAAMANGQLDSTMNRILVDQLAGYQETIKQVFNTTTNNDTKKELKKMYDDAALLILQSKG